MKKSNRADQGKIFILSAPVQSGKTTMVYNWSRRQKSIGGFLTPDVGDLRYLHLLGTRQWLPFETQNANESAPLISIGKFNFFSSSFEKMKEVLLRDIELEKEWIVIDELGRLELKGEGLADVAKTILKRTNDNELRSNLLLLIRSDRLDEITNYFSLVGTLLDVDFFMQSK